MKIKLYYFDGPGIGEAIRLLLVKTHIKFEDIRLKYSDFAKYRDKFELKRLPVLDIDGKQYCQSKAILFFLGIKYDYLPEGVDEVYRVTFVMNTVEELMLKASYYLYPHFGSEDKKQLEQKNFIEVEGPLYMKALEKMLRMNKSDKFIVGSKYSIADFYILGAYEGLIYFKEWNEAFMHIIKDKYSLLYNYIQTRRQDFNLYYEITKTKLYYSPHSKGIEMIRIMLKKAGISFYEYKNEDTFEEDYLPVLEHETCLYKGNNIMKSIGYAFGYYPIDKSYKVYNITWWCEVWNELIQGCEDILKEHEDKEFITTRVPTLFEVMESKLKAGKSKEYVVGLGYTIADFYAVGVWREYITNPKLDQLKTIIATYPTLYNYCQIQHKLLP